MRENVKVNQQARVRDLNISFSGRCGSLNAITDVPGVQVGYKTLIDDLPADSIGPIAVRTGVTAILPRQRPDIFQPVWAGLSSFNGNGEMTGAHWINESGNFIGPILLTNTHSVGIAHQASLKWLTREGGYDQVRNPWLLPVVAETCDAFLNDMNGFHVKEEHVFEAIETAVSGNIAEGNVGGGTGMRCYEFKGGTGTASRIVSIAGEDYVLGTLVQSNFGLRKDLMVRGIPFGRYQMQGASMEKDSGSIIIVVATNAPLLPLQLQRLARRCALGMGRTGTPAYNQSGDIFLAFTTAVEEQASDETIQTHSRQMLEFLNHEDLDPLFEATVDAVEEAILNSMVAATTMVGHRGRRITELCQDTLANWVK